MFLVMITIHALLAQINGCYKMEFVYNVQLDQTVLNVLNLMSTDVLNVLTLFT